MQLFIYAIKKHCTSSVHAVLFVVKIVASKLTWCHTFCSVCPTKHPGLETLEFETTVTVIQIFIKSSMRPNKTTPFSPFCNVECSSQCQSLIGKLQEGLWLVFAILPPSENMTICGHYRVLEVGRV